ncbi:S53 family peptidase [Solimicrobium silvestre]|uniref:Pro-kumamolisin, activation domain n=1 Tax=Solimicrobium silvestre TaxID=2099400 RepID=A0A2S9GWF6_9BURK|nr:S53 family peptidase [Solimicrobium silvestre]PRC92053.1 Pro-kumamolisin, activation domain [Solimicrobium silvestre]
MSRNQGVLIKMRPLAFVIAATFAVSAQAGTTSTWVPTATKSYLNTHPARASAMAQQVMELSAGAPVQIAVSLKLRNKGVLNALSASIGAGGKQYLTPTQFAAQFGPTQAQANVVVSYLQAAGFRNVTVAPNRMLVTADGNAATVKTAFNTTLISYAKNGRQVYVNAGDAMVPQVLADVVLAVHGLQTADLLLPLTQRVSSKLQMQAVVAGHNGTDFSTMYDADSLPAATNISIAIIAQGDISQSLIDLNAFASQSGYPVVSTQEVDTGTKTSDTTGTDEWDLDSQSALAAAGGSVKKMIFYVAPTLADSDLAIAFNRAVTDNLAKTIIVALGECESIAQANGSMATEDQIFQQAMVQGQVFSVGAGDVGSQECPAPSTGQSYPATSPYVIAVGGTTLNSTGTVYASETVWSGSGGGASIIEPAQSWQVNAGVLTGSNRGVPDISFDADPNSGFMVMSSGVPTLIGGTSLSAPLFAGFWARIQSAHGNAVAFPASLFYSNNAAVLAVYHDVTSGSNGAATAKAGWDYASGWGSMDVAKVNALISTAPPPPPPPPTSIIVNGGFESGSTGWNDATGDIGIWSNEPAFAGSYDAWMGGIINSNENLYQKITIPAAAKSANLAFYLHIDTQESGAKAYDMLYVQVRNTSGTLLQTLATFSNANAASGYQLHSYDLSAYKGQAIEIYFNSTNDHEYPTSFVIDNVSVTAQ